LEKINIFEKCWNILQNVEENTLKKSTFPKNVGTSAGGKERQAGERKRRTKLRWVLFWLEVNLLDLQESPVSTASDAELALRVRRCGHSATTSNGDGRCTARRN
jgi:hypothetical protein